MEIFLETKRDYAQTAARIHGELIFAHAALGNWLIAANNRGESIHICQVDYTPHNANIAVLFLNGARCEISAWDAISITDEDVLRRSICLGSALFRIFAQDKTYTEVFELRGIGESANKRAFVLDVRDVFAGAIKKIEIEY
ncbi:MAG: hypothetical protein M0R33_17045 [Methylomonas sp.]|jgi:hypothetical protein|uniref:hypothetical protein n=1 Tax=Methylomonas sp. TaxID=418 RepID=UPI002600E78D|nr:hypothetical protein [Methylomonas sp.]MCK9608153.1 hypothetical protein [Methylomonas sp.]